MENKKVCILGHFDDHQTGWYLFKTFHELGHKVAGIETREPLNMYGVDRGQQIIIKEVQGLSFVPDVVIVLKGLELKPETMDTIKTYWSGATYINWFFDKYLVDKPIWNTKEYFATIKEYDYFLCSLKGVADKLKEQGLENVHYVDEACHPELHSPTYLNTFQKRKYGADVAFVGSLGYHLHHMNRIDLLEKIVTNGFLTKIWGPIVGDYSKIPMSVKMAHAGSSAVNDDHCKVVQSSLVNVGIDQDTSISLGHSARLYRVLCSGGCYLTNATKDLEEMFVINGPEEEITSDQEIVVYYDEQDLINKIDWLLENTDVRVQIGLNGQKKVLEKHTFADRVKEIMELIK